MSSTGSLKKLIDCERKAKALVEEARKACIRMKKKAELDARDFLDKMVEEQNEKVAQMKREVEEEISAKSTVLEKESEGELKAFRSKVPNTDALVDRIVDEVCCNE